MTAGRAGRTATRAARAAPLRHVFAALAFCGALALAVPPLSAQEAAPPAKGQTVPATPAAPTTTAPAAAAPTTTAPTTSAPTAAPTAATTGRLTISKGDAARGTLDYTGWEGIAARAETTLADPGTPQSTLEFLRTQLVDWRSAFLGAQNANAARSEEHTSELQSQR